uniref:Lin1244/Lin1753 domain-containing protein n=1 Tax=Aliarcobacter sp. TaxID=2321116 RepID=UPI004048D28F
MSKTPPNFLFPSNFRHSKNMKRLIKDFNVQGYGIAVYLMETLAETENHIYSLEDIDLLADEMKVSIPVINTVITSYGLFQIVENNGKKFISSHLNKWLEPYYTKVENATRAGKISALRKKQTQEEQLKQLSLLDSSQRPLNDRSTINKLINKKKKEEKKEEKRSVEEDIKFLSCLSARDIEKKQISDLVFNVDLFRKTNFTLQQLVTYARDFESYLRAELSKHELKIK